MWTADEVEVEAALRNEGELIRTAAQEAKQWQGGELGEAAEVGTEAKPVVPAFYAGRSVFITGATGFMGQVLVARLLGTCPGVLRVFLLLRDKAGHDAPGRLQRYKDLQVFDKIRKTCPEQLEKLRAVHGDLVREKLGLSPDALAQLQEVSLVFHCAASTRFQEPLRSAAQLNVRSAQAVLALCDALPRMQVLVHVSTAYSNGELFSVEERVYPPPVEPTHLLNLVDALPDQLLDRITPEYIEPKFNTYTFTKAVAESLVAAHPSPRYSVAIFRPSIVVSSWREPFPGWAVGASGPALHAKAIAAGVLQVTHGRGALHTNLLPVDVAADAMIVAAWDTGIDRPPEVRVYNACSQDNPVSWNQFRRHVLCAARNTPSPRTIAYPQTLLIPNRYAFLALEFLAQTLPLTLAHFLCWVFGVKMGVNLVQLSARLRAINRAFAPFVLNEWHFEDTNLSRLRKRLSNADRRIFNTDTRTVDWGQHLNQQVRIITKHEPTKSDVQRLNRLRWVHYCYWLLLLAACCKLLHTCLYVFISS